MKGKTRETARILHVYNVASVATSFASFQRELGLKADVITKSLHLFGFEEIYCPKRKLIPLRFFLTYNITHFHGNAWFCRKMLKHLDDY
jgi:hypothetical protein